MPFVKGFNYVTWNFTEASHGKGAPDGVGAALKNLADRTVSYGNNIPDVNTMYEQLSAHSSVRLYMVTLDEISSGFEHVPPSLKTGTMKIHQVRLWDMDLNKLALLTYHNHFLRLNATDIVIKNLQIMYLFNV